MTSAIVARRLTKIYGTHTVVRDLSFEVERGAIFGFLGPNGSGKSTTIKMLCGLVRPSGGSGSVTGYDVDRDGDAVRRTIGYMSQSFALYGELTVGENLEFYGRAYGLPAQQRAERKRAVIDLVGLGQFERQRAVYLSGGWKQRLALASALLHQPQVIFLDEPTAGIDPVARRELWDLLFKLAGEGVTLFVTTHYMDEAERCSRVGYIYDGDLIALGTLAELRQLPGVQPAGTKRYAIAVDEIMRGFAAARVLPYVYDATIFGRSLHLIVAEEITPERLHDDLAAAAGGVGSVEPIDPSLEDVFVALTRERTA